MRSRRYKRGDRVKINIHKSVSPEMLAWLNKQSNQLISSFAAATILNKLEILTFQKLYQAAMFSHYMWSLHPY